METGPRPENLDGLFNLLNQQITVLKNAMSEHVTNGSGSIKIIFDFDAIAKTCAQLAELEQKEFLPPDFVKYLITYANFQATSLSKKQPELYPPGSNESIRLGMEKMNFVDFCENFIKILRVSKHPGREELIEQIDLLKLFLVPPDFEKLD